LIIRNQRDLPPMDQSDAQFALLDIWDHGECEVIDGKWVDRHGYRELMRRNVEHDRMAGP
jgi:hypothetical protein